MANAIPQELVDALVKTIDAANAQAVKYRTLVGDRSEAVANVLNTSDDEKVAEFRAWRDKIQEDIRKAQAALEANSEKMYAYAESLIQQTDEDPEAVKAAYLEARQTATKMRAGLVGFFDEETVAKMYEEQGIEEITNLRGTKSKGATGIKRPRLLTASVNGEEVSKDGKVSFTLLAQHITSNIGKVSSADLRAAAFKAANTDDLSSLPEGTEVTFTLDIPGALEGKPKTAEVTFVPKVTAETEDDDSEE